MDDARNTRTPSWVQPSDYISLRIRTKVSPPEVAWQAVSRRNRGGLFSTLPLTWVDISADTVDKPSARLRLNSRSTLHTPARKEKIRLAIQMQLEASGTISLKTQRKNQAERIIELERQNAALQAALDHQIEQLCRVVANASAKGWDVDLLLQPLLPNNRNLTK
jgi:hypothetical protein